MPDPYSCATCELYAAWKHGRQLLAGIEMIGNARPSQYLVTLSKDRSGDLFLNI
jgi:hypothetical protein